MSASLPTTTTLLLGLALLGACDRAGSSATSEKRASASETKTETKTEAETKAFTGGVLVAGDDAWREKAAVTTFVDCQPIH